MGQKADLIQKVRFARFGTTPKIDHSVNMNQLDISGIERGIRGVKGFELKAFAEILGLTANGLLS